MVDPPAEGRKKRISLSKRQRETAAGAELLSLCQTITEDGHLSDEEINALRRWVDDNATCNLPAQAFLLGTVSQVIEDGRVTEDERDELYRAIETVLPPDIREVFRGARRLVEEAAASARQGRQAARQLEREAKQRNRPVRSVNFMVAGCRYQGRPESIERFATAGGRAYLVRDRANRFSRNAVEVRLHNGAEAGYVPEELAVDVAPLLDEGLPHIAVVTKVLTGGRTPIPVVQARIFELEATIPDLVLEQDVPSKPVGASALRVQVHGERRGCLSALVLVGALAWVASWVAVAMSL